MTKRNRTGAQIALEKHVRSFANQFPHGQRITKFLGEAGCTIIWAQETDLDYGRRRPWTLHFRLPPEVEAEFGFSRELLLLATTWSEFQVRSLDALRQEVSRTRTVDPEVAFIYCFDEQAPLKAYEWCGNEFTVVALHRDLIASPDPAKAVRTVLQQSFYGRNFYEESGPVTGERFFGRLNLLRKLTVDIAASRPVGLFGLRRIGKTSVLKELSTTLDSEHVYLYVDLQDSRLSGDARHLLLVVARQLNVLMNGRFLPARTVEAEWADKRLSLATRIMDTLAETVATDGRRFILALDELEVLYPTASSYGLVFWDDVLAGLRSIGQSLPRFSVIFAGASPYVFEMARAGDRDNPVFQYGHPTYVGCMSDRELERMVTHLGKRTGITWAPGTLPTLYEATGGHPFLSRLVCSHVVSGLEPPATVDVRRLESGLRSYIQSGVPTFSQLVESLTRHYPDEMTLLREIAAVGEYSPPAVGSEKLGHLLAYDIVGRTQKGAMKVRIGLLREWLTAA